MKGKTCQHLPSFQIGQMCTQNNIYITFYQLKQTFLMYFLFFSDLTWNIIQRIIKLYLNNCHVAQAFSKKKHINSQKLALKVKFQNNVEKSVQGVTLFSLHQLIESHRMLVAFSRGGQALAEFRDRSTSLCLPIS